MACFNSSANPFVSAGQRPLEQTFWQTPSPSHLRWDRPINGAVLFNQPLCGKLRMNEKVNSKTLGLSATAIRRSMFNLQYITRETATVVHLRKSFCWPISYQKQNEKRKVKMKRYNTLSCRWIRSTFKRIVPLTVVASKNPTKALDKNTLMSMCEITTPNLNFYISPRGTHRYLWCLKAQNTVKSIIALS